MSSETMKPCFNSNCKVLTDTFRRGWRRRTGDCAYLCDGCATAYEDGKFCETFHLSDSGWRCCESCGKKIHCGCIVSFHMFVLLDAGGIECLTCARKSYILTPNPAWPPPSHFIPSLPERMKDTSVNNWSQIAGSGSLPWRQAPSLLRQSNFDSDVKGKQPFGFDVLGDVDRNHSCEKHVTSSCDMKQGVPYERLENGKLKIGSVYLFGNFGLEMKEQPGSLETSSKMLPVSNDSLPLYVSSNTLPKSEKDDPQFAMVHREIRLMSKSGKQDSQLVASGDVERGNGGTQSIFLPQQGLEMTEKSLQHISDKAKLTPLFEKMLSASDAGRIGRLVLPKKCAEAYFPPITCPEGLPLKVMDVKGREWIFQFRFWPNNNSRMYVLEGINPCIQSLQLQAGDIVIFSRLEPEGKLIMGGRKTAAIHSAGKGAYHTMVSADTLASEQIFEDATQIHAKKKSRNSNANNRRLPMETDNMLSFTLKEAQQLMRPPSKVVPSIFVVEGYEFEEFKGDPLVIGRPTIPGTDHSGEKVLWVECEQCCKWRKVPAEAILPSGWICSENAWDSSRSLCSAAEEIPREKLEEMIGVTEKDYPRKEQNNLERTSGVSLAPERSNQLANMETQCEGDSVPAQRVRSTRHPNHKSGWYQPPMEKGYNHGQSCYCAVCCSSKLHQSRTLLEIREEVHHQRGSEPVKNGTSNMIQDHRKCYHDEAAGGRSSSSPMKSLIDLNMKPEREEELWILDS